MSKKKRRYDYIKGKLDMDDYNSILDDDPRILTEIENGLKSGDTPEGIGRALRRSHSHKWPQSKIIEGAARHIKTLLDS